MAENISPTQVSSADYEVLTPERVKLQYDLAGIGSRSAAALIDTVLQWLLILALFALTFFLGIGNETLATTLGLAVMLGVFIVTWGYYLAFELAWNGQTPGKRRLGIRVIREKGYPLRHWDAVVRNLVRIIDGPPFGVIIGLLVMLLNARSKRLGDFAAGTVVVREAKGLRFISGLNAHEAKSAEVTHTSVPSLASEDATLVRDFLARRQTMDATARAALARRLSGHLATAYGLQPPEHPEAFLQWLVGAQPVGS